MRTKLCAIVLIFNFLFGCVHSDNNSSSAIHDAPTRLIKTAHSEGVILPATLAPGVIDQCSRPAPSGEEGFWEPDESQILRLESLLLAYIMANPSPMSSNLAKALPSYLRQYIGVVYKGRKVIYVNSFDVNALAKGDDAWRREALIACDGGSSFWGVEFDVETETFSNLFTNGSGRI